VGRVVDLADGGDVSFGAWLRRRRIDLLTGSAGSRPAIVTYREALGLVLTTGDRHLESAILERLAATQEAYGHVDDARRARRRALSLRDTMDPVTA
jgi:hypothetical protein